MTDRLTLAVVTAGLSEDSTTTRLGEAIAQAASTTVENAGQHVIDESALENLPTVVAATGGSPRHSLVLDTAMRPLLSYLKALVLPLGIYAASEDWGHSDLQRRIDRVGASLGTMLLAGSQGSAGSTDGASHGDAARPGLRREVKDEFSDVPDFASLLASVGS